MKMSHSLTTRDVAFKKCKTVLKTRRSQMERSDMDRFSSFHAALFSRYNTKKSKFL